MKRLRGLIERARAVWIFIFGVGLSGCADFSSYGCGWFGITTAAEVPGRPDLTDADGFVIAPPGECVLVETGEGQRVVRGEEPTGCDATEATECVVLMPGERARVFRRGDSGEVETELDWAAVGEDGSCALECE